jgi:hypothetical protein
VRDEFGMVTLIRSGAPPHGACAAAALLGLRRDTRLAGGKQLRVAVKQPESEYRIKGERSSIATPVARGLLPKL